MKTNKLTFLLICYIIIISNVAGQKITTYEFIEECKNKDQLYLKSFNELLEKINPEEVKITKKIKSELNASNPIMIIEDKNEFPSPCNLHKVNLKKDKYTFKCLSLGDMAGFKKTLMLPIIKIYNEKGELVESIKESKYIVLSPTMNLPLHLYSKWVFDTENAGIYYIMVASDNAPTGRALNLILQLAKTPYPVKRSPYGKYRIIFE